MKRKIIKLVLIVFGVICVAAGLIYLSNHHQLFLDIYVLAVFLIAGLVPIGIALILHAKDIAGTKKSLSMVCKVLGYFWLIGAILNLAGMILAYICMGKRFLPFLNSPSLFFQI